MDILLNKKVLLRERKRHTARHVASTPSVVLTGVNPIPGPDPDGGTPSLGVPLSRSRWGYPHLDLAGVDGGVPHPWWRRGYPPSGLNQGTPLSTFRWGYPITGQVLPPPHLDMARVPPSGRGRGTPHLDLAGVAPSPRNGGQTENITSRHPSDAGGNYSDCHLNLACSP